MREGDTTATGLDKLHPSQFPVGTRVEGARQRGWITETLVPKKSLWIRVVWDDGNESFNEWFAFGSVSVVPGEYRMPHHD